MTLVDQFQVRPGPGRGVTLAAATAGLVVAVGLGVAIGEPMPSAWAMVGGLVGLLAIGFTLARPWPGFLVLVCSSIMLIVALVTPTRAANAFDALLPAIALGTLYAASRSGVDSPDRMEAGPAHDSIRTATARFARAAGLYFVIAFVSLLPGLVLGRADQSLDSGILLIRGLQGAALFPLGMWWVRSSRRLNQVVGALLVGGALFSVINAIGLSLGVRRAGITWIVNSTHTQITSPNEAATAMLMLWVLLIVRQSVRRSALNLLGLPIVFFMLIFTQSRSGLLAWLTFNLFTLRWAKLRLAFVGILAVVLAVPFVPGVYWWRLSRTLALRPGSYEAFSTLIRIYGWRVAWSVFLDHPILGVGYIGFRFVNDAYHNLPFRLGTTENVFLEIATGMGIVGLLVTGAVLIRMFRLGFEIRRVTRPGSWGHEFARYNTPFLASLIVANLTADNWTGMVGLAQLALWFMLLVRAGHLTVASEQGV